MKTLIIIIGLLGSGLIGCSKLPPKPIMTNHQIVNDRTLIPKPRATSEDKWGEYARVNTFDRIAPLADPRTYGVWASQALGGDPGREAENVNFYDDVADSTWYTHRNSRGEMTLEEIGRGAVQTRIAPTGPLIVVSGKGSGVTPGFVVKDEKGERFVLKFDPSFACGLATGADVVSSRFFYAAGFNVPENNIEYIDPTRFELSPKAKTRDDYGRKISLSQVQFKRLVDELPPCKKEGKVRTMASRFLPGVPIGPFGYSGRRRDDANDRIRHELRRELRGAMVLGAWLNNTDMTSYNTLDMFQKVEGERGYVKHFLIDFGATLGSGSTKYKSNQYGNEYYIDPPIIGLNLLAFGFRDPEYLAEEKIRFKSIGIFPTEHFDPENWRPSNPHPGLTAMTKRDGFWGARHLASFSDKQIEVVVQQGQFREEGAEAELIRILKYRRDKALRYWMAQAGSLDRFEAAGEVPEFRFLDWRRKSLPIDDEGLAYRWEVKGPSSRLRGVSAEPVIRPFDAKIWGSWKDALGKKPSGRYVTLKIVPIQTRAKETWVYKAPQETRKIAPATTAYFYLRDDGKLIWVGVDRSTN